MKIPIWDNAGIPEKLSFRSPLHQDTKRNRILLLGMLLVASTFLMHGPGTRAPDLHPGDIAPADYRAPFEIRTFSSGNNPPFLSFKIVPEGTPILLKGTIVTKEEDDIIRLIRIHQSPGKVFESAASSLILGSLLFIGLFLVFESIVLPPPEFETINRPRTFAILALFVMVPLTIDRGLQYGLSVWMENLPSIRESELLVFSLPAVVGSILVSIFLGQRLAAVSALSFGLILSIPFTHPSWLGFYAFLISMFGVGASPYFKSRLGLLETGGLIGLFSFLLSFLFHFWKGFLVPFELLTSFAFSICGGLVVAMIVSLCLPLIERGFGILSDMALTELLDVNHPLLRAFFQKAPGSYQHSMALSYLAEAAALAIGENPKLARVSSYFHDIGKMEKPQYFIENQASYNRHELLTPRMSAMILIDHVRRGIEIARRNRLPETIIRAIPEHHGTRLMQYFYRKAAEQETGSLHPPQESDFRYPGPKPHSKTTAIIMLADAVEAVSRILQRDNPTPARIQGMVEEVFNSILHDGQLDESPLSIAELAAIRKAFVQTLVSTHHHRIPYPKSQTNNSEAPKTSVAKKSANAH